MRPVLTAVLVLAGVTGCATAGTTNAEVFNTARIAGVVALPEGMSGGNPCASLTVAANDPKGAQVGRATVRESRSRCSYEISQLPSDVEISITVKPASEWHCANGATPAFTAGSQPVKLRDNETRTHDFRAMCTQDAG
jgi:hypothetical protein